MMKCLGKPGGGWRLLSGGAILDQETQLCYTRLKQNDVVTCVHMFGQSKPWNRFNEDRLSCGWHMSAME